MRHLVIGIAALVGVATACSSGPTPTAQDRQALAASITAARSAAAVHDADGARRELETLRATLEKQVRDGHISAEQAAEIEAAADDVDALLDMVTTTTTAPPPPEPDDRGEGKGHGNGHGNGQGNED